MATQEDKIAKKVVDALKRGEDKENHVSIPEKPKNVNEFLNELVDVRLFKDSDKYKNDLTVVVNGYGRTIKRGYLVQIPRYAAMVIDEHLRQEALIANKQDVMIQDFASASQKYGVHM